MFLHLGGDVSVLQKDIIGIFDLAVAEKNGPAKELLEIAKGEKSLYSIAMNEKAKSFIVTDSKIYLSPISSITLMKRALNRDEQNETDLRGENDEQ